MRLTRLPPVPPLSIEECRTFLGLPDLSDEQVAEIRDALYAFAHAFIDVYL